MKAMIIAMLAFFQPTHATASEEIPESIAAAAGVCNLQAIAFANQVFNLKANAQAKCDELVKQTGNVASDCSVVKQKNKKFLAKFRKPLQLNNLALNALIVGLENFLVGNNIFANKQIAVQAAVTDGCG